MIRDVELLQGAAILRILQFKPGVKVTRMAHLHGSLYEVAFDGHKSTILLKLSTRKKAGWQYVFSEKELKALGDTRTGSGGPVFIGFICHTDGVCCIPYGLLSEIMGGEISAGKALSIRRTDGTSYRVTGPQRRKFKRTFPANWWPRTILQEIQQ